MKPITCFLLVPVVLWSISCETAQKADDQAGLVEDVDKYDNYTDWAIYRGDKKSNQYAELAQINAANVHRLVPVWEHHTGDPNGPSMYSNPIIIDRLMYFTTPKLDAVALDATNGEEVWKFESAKHNPGNKVFRGRSRGVTYWEGVEGQRIFHFVNNRAYALDAKSGEMIKSFGDGGFIDLRQDLGVNPFNASIEVTTPGIIHKNFLIVTSRVPEEYNSTPGHVRAYDAVTGEFKWIFHTLPQKGELGYDTWEWVDGEVYGGANPWGGFSIDEKRGWVFFATGSPANDFYGGFRKGTNLFGNCVVALDATTGEYKWHFQTVHHDIWDYDNPPAPILATIESQGTSKDAVIQLTKMGLTFVLDRDTGEPLFPVQEIPVPASTVPGEQAWPTQPFPTRPPPLVRLSLEEADLTSITPESRASALEQFKKYQTGFIYTPPSLQGTITTPSHQGGVEWGGASFDPYSNVLYVNANEAPSINTLRGFYDLGDTANPVELGATIYQKNCTSCHGLERQGNPPVYPALTSIQKTDEAVKVTLRQGLGIMPAFTAFSNKELDAILAYLRSDPADNQVETINRRFRYSVQIPFFVDLDGVPAIAPPWGTLNAVDMNTGAILWKVPLGEYPELVERGIRYTGAKNFGGPVATSGGVVFIAATPDEKIRAFDTHSGSVLWEYKLPAGGYATPSIYVIDGKQYVVIAAGGGGKNATKYGDSIIVFALPSENTQSDKVEPGVWIDLFDGLTLNGWVQLNGSHQYMVKDGTIIGRTVAGSPNSFLCTQLEFGDFELELEVMIDSITNSGIQIRSKARPFTVGTGL